MVGSKFKKPFSMKFLSKILLIMAIWEEQVLGISPEQAAAIARLKGLMARLNQAKESFYENVLDCNFSSLRTV